MKDKCVGSKKLVLLVVFKVELKVEMKCNLKLMVEFKKVNELELILE